MLPDALSNALNIDFIEDKAQRFIAILKGGVYVGKVVAENSLQGYNRGK
jgi:hypothetical protein